jgi:pre-mRNA-processing factor SLU7
MRDNPHADAEDPSLLPFAGDNFVRQSGEALKIPELQVFAWQTAGRGMDVNLQANPSQLEKMHKEHVARKSEEARQREKILAEAYGDTNGSSSEDSDLDPLLDAV